MSDSGGTTDAFEFVLLPGMHGTGDLFDPFVHALPPAIRRRVVSYPVDRVVSYSDLLERIISELAGSGPYVVLGESYSGALALRLAAARPENVRAVVLCQSFVRSPRPSWWRWIARPAMFGLPFRRLVVRLLIANGVGMEPLVEKTANSVAAVRPEVLAARLQEILTLDCSDELKRCRAPILYLQALHDRVVLANSVRTILKARPDVTVRQLPGPHLLLQSTPAAAWREIADFLRERALLPADAAQTAVSRFI